MINLLFALMIAAAPGGVHGQVKLEGAIPEPTKIEPTTDTTICGQQGLVDESILAEAASRGLKNVAVWIEKTKTPAPKDAPAIDNYRCRYEPHVLIVPAKTEVIVRNRDRFLHTTQAKTKEGKLLFNVALPSKDQEVKKRFDKPGMYSLVCDVHTWMKGWAVVNNGELSAVTDEHGAFEIKDVPPGRYTMHFWHEVLGDKKVEVEIGAGKTAELAVSYALAAKP